MGINIFSPFMSGRDFATELEELEKKTHKTQIENYADSDGWLKRKGFGVVHTLAKKLRVVHRKLHEKKNKVDNVVDKSEVKKLQKNLQKEIPKLVTGNSQKQNLQAKGLGISSETSKVSFGVSASTTRTGQFVRHKTVGKRFVDLHDDDERNTNALLGARQEGKQIGVDGKNKTNLTTIQVINNSVGSADNHAQFQALEPDDNDSAGYYQNLTDENAWGRAFTQEINNAPLDRAERPTKDHSRKFNDKSSKADLIELGRALVQCQGELKNLDRVKKGDLGKLGDKRVTPGVTMNVLLNASAALCKKYNLNAAQAAEAIKCLRKINLFAAIAEPSAPAHNVIVKDQGGNFSQEEIANAWRLAIELEQMEAVGFDLIKRLMKPDTRKVGAGQNSAAKYRDIYLHNYLVAAREKVNEVEKYRKKNPVADANLEAFDNGFRVRAYDARGKWEPRPTPLQEGDRLLWPDPKSIRTYIENKLKLMGMVNDELVCFKDPLNGKKNALDTTNRPDNPNPVTNIYNDIPYRNSGYDLSGTNATLLDRALIGVAGQSKNLEALIDDDARYRFPNENPKEIVIGGAFQEHVILSPVKGEANYAQMNLDNNYGAAHLVSCGIYRAEDSEAYKMLKKRLAKPKIWLQRVPGKDANGQDKLNWLAKTSAFFARRVLMKNKSAYRAHDEVVKIPPKAILTLEKALGLRANTDKEILKIGTNEGGLADAEAMKHDMIYLLTAAIERKGGGVEYSVAKGQWQFKGLNVSNGGLQPDLNDDTLKQVVRWGLLEGSQRFSRLGFKGQLMFIADHAGGRAFNPHEKKELIDLLMTKFSFRGLQEGATEEERKVAVQEAKTALRGKLETIFENENKPRNPIQLIEWAEELGYVKGLSEKAGALKNAYENKEHFHNLSQKGPLSKAKYKEQLEKANKAFDAAQRAFQGLLNTECERMYKKDGENKVDINAYITPAQKAELQQAAHQAIRDFINNNDNFDQNNGGRIKDNALVNLRARVDHLHDLLKENSTVNIKNSAVAGDFKPTEVSWLNWNRFGIAAQKVMASIQEEGVDSGLQHIDKAPRALTEDELVGLYEAIKEKQRLGHSVIMSSGATHGVKVLDPLKVASKVLTFGQSDWVGEVSSGLDITFTRSRAAVYQTSVGTGGSDTLISSEKRYKFGFGVGPSLRVGPKEYGFAAGFKFRSSHERSKRTGVMLRNPRNDSGVDRDYIRNRLMKRVDEIVLKSTMDKDGNLIKDVNQYKEHHNIRSDILDLITQELYDVSVGLASVKTRTNNFGVSARLGFDAKLGNIPVIGKLLLGINVSYNYAYAKMKHREIGGTTNIERNEIKTKHNVSANATLQFISENLAKYGVDKALIDKANVAMKASLSLDDAQSVKEYGFFRNEIGRRHTWIKFFGNYTDNAGICSFYQRTHSNAISFASSVLANIDRYAIDKAKAFEGKAMHGYYGSMDQVKDNYKKLQLKTNLEEHLDRYFNLDKPDGDPRFQGPAWLAAKPNKDAPTYGRLREEIFRNNPFQRNDPFQRNIPVQDRDALKQHLMANFATANEYLELEEAWQKNNKQRVGEEPADYLIRAQNEGREGYVNAYVKKWKEENKDLRPLNETDAEFAARSQAAGEQFINRIFADNFHIDIFRNLKPSMDSYLEKMIDVKYPGWDISKALPEYNKEMEFALRGASLTGPQNDQREDAIRTIKQQIARDVVACMKATPTNEYREYFELSPKYFEQLNDLTSFIKSEKAILGWNKNPDTVKKIKDAQKQLDKLKQLDDETINKYYEYRFSIVDQVHAVDKSSGAQFGISGTQDDKILTQQIVTYC